MEPELPIAPEAKLIHRLDEALVNKIAAGEVVVRPMNALKEMIENSLDAGSTSIVILVKEGGVKMLQIQDNGSGIKKADFPLLCERFATSKIAKFDDLRHLNTYGFRGEALSSISRVARLTVTSMTKDSPVAYKAHFVDGVLAPPKPGDSAEPKPCAGVQGTTILVEEMFYNTPARKKALRNPNDEYKSILDMVSKYAIHNHRCSFTLKKFGESSADLSTSVASSALEPLRIVYGVDVSKSLTPIQTENKNLCYSANAFISTGASQIRKAAFILFINGRLVESSALKKAIESAYNPYIPKGTHPFCYISLTIKPEHVDVNVSPTKSEVYFLHEHDVLSELQALVTEKLGQLNAGRNFNPNESVADKFQEKNPIVQKTLKSASTSQLSNGGGALQRSGSASSIAPAPQSLVRNDSRTATLDAYVSTIRKQGSLGSTSSLASSQQSDLSQSQNSLEEDSQLTLKTLHPLKKRRRTDVNTSANRLTSVSDFLDRLDAECDKDLERGLEHYVFVGRLSDAHFLLQFNTKLCLVDLKTMVHEMFFQSCFVSFGRFAKISLSPPAPIREVLAAHLKARAHPLELSRADELVHDYVETLLTWRELLSEYFGIMVSEDGKELLSLPQLVQNYLPDLRFTPKLLYELAARVDWSGEEACLFSTALILADFYTFTSQHSTEDIQHQLLPALRTQLKPPKAFLTSGTIDVITSMEQLYKVFERC